MTNDELRLVPHSSFVIRHSSFAIRHSPFAIRHSPLNVLQLLLIAFGVAITIGGGIMLVRGAGKDASGNNVPRPYLTLGIIAVGLVIVYHTISDYQSMDGIEITGLLLFGLAFGAALAVKIFIIDKFDFDAGHIEHEPPGKPEGKGNSSSDNRAGGEGS